MNKKQQNIFFLLLFGIVVVLFFMNLNIKSSHKHEKENFENFEKSAKEIAKLKTMKNLAGRDLANLLKLKEPTSTSEKSHSQVFSFENLNQYNLNRLIKKIQGSNIKIKELEISNDNTNHATLKLEVLK